LFFSSQGLIAKVELVQQKERKQKGKGANHKFMERTRGYARKKKKLGMEK
jgi:hypothetical protein